MIDNSSKIYLFTFYHLQYIHSMNSNHFIEKLKERELLYQFTSSKNPQGFDINSIYCGFDATAPSLQAGNLLSLSMLRVAASCNISTITLIGGATTLIGDPTDKHESRKKLPEDVVAKNLAIVQKQLQHLLPNAKLANNFDWISKFKFIDFLNNIASRLSLGAMTKLSMFANRLANNDPLSLQEFMYPVMQAYDFLYLFENENCNAQCGGSDQWCNILTGADLINQKHGTSDTSSALGVTVELLTTPDGRKMGKSEKGAVYINPDIFSPFEFWQYWRNVDDAMVVKCLKKLTLIDIETIEDIANNNINDAKIMLANDLTSWVHSKEEAQNAQAQSHKIFVEGNMDDAKEIITNDPKLVAILIATGEITTNSDAKRLIEQNAIKINGETISDKEYSTELKSFVLSIGKKKFFKIIVQQ